MKNYASVIIAVIVGLILSMLLFLITSKIVKAYNPFNDLAAIAIIYLIQSQVDSPEIEPIIIKEANEEVIKSSSIEKISIGATQEMNDLVKRAWEISDQDFDFITTIDQESNWNIRAVGDGGDSFGLCQWNIRWHKNTVNDPNFHDPYWQLEKCYDYYSGVKNNGTITRRLYGYNNRKSRERNFNILSN